MSKKHVPTAEQRRKVLNMAIAGFPQATIAKAIGVRSMTVFAKAYKEELSSGKVEATGEVAGHLMEKIRNGDTTAMIFWMKTQAGWNEKKDINHTSDDGSMTPRSITVIGVDP